MSGNDSPRVAVVLINWRREDEVYTRECIESLYRCGYGSLDVILVDNGSPPEVIENLRAAFPLVDIVHTGANLGFTGGNNYGITRALQREADFVLILNNDTVVEPSCVERLVTKALKEDRVGAVGGKILYYDAPDRIWFGGGEMLSTRAIGRHIGIAEIDKVPDGDEAREVTFLTGCCMLVPAEVLRELGGFVEDFFAYVEDVEFSHRLRTRGYRLIYESQARLYHRVPLHEPTISPQKIVLRDRNRRRFVRRRFGFFGRARFAAFFYPTRLAHAARYLVQGDVHRFRAICRGMTEP